MLKSIAQHLRWSAPHALLSVGLLLVELLIAAFAHGWLRNFVGDVLVVVLLYCALHAFLKLPVVASAIGVFCFAVCIEIAQFLRLPQLLGLQKGSRLGIAVGATFDWMDVLAYLLGSALIILAIRAKTFAQPKHIKPISRIK